MSERMECPLAEDYGDDFEAYELDMNMYVYDLLYGADEDEWYRQQAEEYENDNSWQSEAWSDYP